MSKKRNKNEKKQQGAQQKSNGVSEEALDF